jgi:hypothetical protein
MKTIKILKNVFAPRSGKTKGKVLKAKEILTLEDGQATQLIESGNAELFAPELPKKADAQEEQKPEVNEKPKKAKKVPVAATDAA